MWLFLMNVSYARPHIFKSCLAHFLLTVLISKMTVVVFLCYCMSAVYLLKRFILFMYKNIFLTEKNAFQNYFIMTEMEIFPMLMIVLFHVCLIT